MSLLNKIEVKNNSMLDPTEYTVWVAGFIEQMDDKKPVYWSLQSDGTFALSASGTGAFLNVDNGLVIEVPDVSNYGNNRLVFTITKKGSLAPKNLSPITGYTAYPFPGEPGVAPAGPYDIFEFGPNAQYDVSAVDSFGLNLSFTVKGDTLIYGADPTFKRAEIQTAFTSFMDADPLGNDGYKKLLYTSPIMNGYPDVIENQFSAIVAPKDWLAIYPDEKGLKGYWHATIDAFFTKGNKIDLFLNAAVVGRYTGTSNGKKYSLIGPKTTDFPKGIQIEIPASDFKAKNQGFIQAVRGQNPGESIDIYRTFNQIEAAIYEAMSRGVLLDGVVAEGDKITDSYTSDAWVAITNWYTNHKNTYNDAPSVYDAYAKFMHECKITIGDYTNTIFGKNEAGSFGMAYGFSLDESPNVSKAWKVAENVPSKPVYNIGKGQDVTLVIGPWIDKV